jgi:2-oxoglutarate dehydrogenase E2 component (dihydrolipoamide succinyltransferase)
MPQLGESIVEGTVVRWAKQEGDEVGEYESLLEVNTDKVDTEVPSPAAGRLLKILIGEGVTVKAGTVLAWIGQPGETIPEPGGPYTALEEKTQPSVTPGRDPALGFISPVVARLAQENHLDLTKVPGSGEGGRITKKDVLAYLAEHPSGQPAAAPAWETPGDGDLFHPTGPLNGEAASPDLGVTQPVKAVDAGRLLRLDPMRKAIAERMVVSKHTSPHVTTVMEADMSRVAAHRAANRAAYERDGAHLTYTAYFVAAAVAGLKAFPLVNSSWTEEGIRIHAAIHFGVAVSLGSEGLIAPVIRDADGLSLLGIARAVNDLAERARSRRLQPDEVRGGTFSLTNHGTAGSLLATPVIIQPQCGILGVGAIQKRVVVIDDMIAIRPMVYLSFTFDHRILDGFVADGFLGRVVEVLEGWD